MTRAARQELVVFIVLLAFGVVGRWAEPSWNFTPLAAVTALGAVYFRGLLPAILLPSAVLAISDLALPAHDSWLVQISVHVMSLIPLGLGRAARRTSGWQQIACWGMCGFVPATAFFLVTNLAVWASRSLYAPTLAGLLDCYAHALPFYRTMLAGDVCYVSLMTACLVAARLLEGQPTAARAQAVSHHRA
jgi:hypothetical protein